MKRCTHCGESNYIKNGSYQGIRRYRCKGCGKSFSDKVRKFNYEDKERALEMYMNNVGIRKAAGFMRCSPALIVRWIKAFGERIAKQVKRASEELETKQPDVIEMDEIYTFVKKSGAEPWYGLLIAGDDIALLRIR